MIFTFTEETTTTKTKTKTTKLCNPCTPARKTNPNPVEFKSTSYFEVLNMHNQNTTLTIRYLIYWKPVNQENLAF
jgi:hypothetical protein